MYNVKIRTFITSSLGALPETTGGRGFLMDVSKDQMETVANYAKLTIDTINQAYDDPDGFSERLAQQKSFANKMYSWGNASLGMGGMAADAFVMHTVIL